jgi:hypothetical protein
MRDPVSGEKVLQLLEELGCQCRGPGTVYITGGSSAVVMGWRTTTIDVDLKFLPEPEGIFEVLPRLKNTRNVNIELAAPDDFVPALPGWQERSRWIATFNRVDFRHFDFYTQVLSKLERDHAKDRIDVAAMVETGLVDPATLLELYDRLTPDQLNRYPAIEPDSVRAAVVRLGEKDEL